MCVRSVVAIYIHTCICTKRVFAGLSLLKYENLNYILTYQRLVSIYVYVNVLSVFL